MLNTVLRHTFDEAYLSEHLPDLQSHLQKVKAVVTFMKQSGLASRLPHGVCQEVSTRWNSKVAMLKSVYRQFEEIENIIEERGRSLMDNLSKVFIKDIIDLLEPFKEATEKLEQEKQPTLPLVLLYYTKLQKHLAVAPTDSPTVTALKRRATEYLKSKLRLDEAHTAATLLCPPFRGLRALDETERNAAYAYVRAKMQDMPAPSSHRESDDCSSAVAKRPRWNLREEFQEWQDVAEPQQHDELDKYLHCDGADHITNVLEWW
ncbi:hypothetical protein HPB50_014857 [Hyalomma asiaticum]|uniref:Uncharacterized protein n=1 Tax=Hyalomma asiaticum TaxID=266040 RepID=A0ACB7RUW6_HYAAI|nr:hypothetical protein HPB50_014857 [Hyalomma asiaticum]